MAPTRPSQPKAALQNPTRAPEKRIDPESGRIQKTHRRGRDSETLRQRVNQALDAGLDIAFSIEQKIKTSTQALLEEAMFDFCQTWAPDVLRKNNWLVPEMTELSLFKRHLVNFEGAQRGLLQLQWHEFLHALEMMKHIRHTAVHRLVVGLQGVENMTTDAVALLEAIQDAKRHAKMSMIRAMVKAGDWDKTLLAIETPLESVLVLPFYGRNINSIDLTKDDDDALMEDITAGQISDPACNTIAGDQGHQLVNEDSQFQHEQGGMTRQASQGDALAAGGNGHIAEEPRIQQGIERVKNWLKHEDGEVFQTASLDRANFELPGKENSRPVLEAPEHFARHSGLEAKFNTGVLQAPVAAGDGCEDSKSLKSFAPAQFGVPTQISPAPAVLGVLSHQSQLQIGSQPVVASVASTAVATINSRDPDAYVVIDDPIVDMKSFLSRASQ